MKVAEKMGFEPTIPFPVYSLSRGDKFKLTSCYSYHVSLYSPDFPPAIENPILP